ncbi:MAG: HDOD domain-containing protein [Fibrobacterota bacterium]
MIKVMLIIRNKRELDVLSIAFQQKSIKVIPSEPNYANYVKCLQYNPDLLLLEMPTPYNEQIYFTRLLKKNKRTSRMPVVSYGNYTEPGVIKTFFINGVTKYYQRPLRFGEMMTDMNVLLKNKGIQIAGEPVAADQKKRDEEFAVLLNKEKMGSEKLDIMVRYIGKLLAFPFTITRILKIADDIKSGAPELARVIKTDSAMTTTILKVANSVLFASRDRKISDIREAVVRIGFRETKNIALSMMVMKIMDSKEKTAGYNRVDFWYHSLAVAVLSEKFARHAGMTNTEEAFVAGLLHDFGILLLDEFFPEIFEKLMDETTKNAGNFVKVSKELLGITHNDLVSRLFETWNIPRHITQSIINHHDFKYFKDEADAELTKLTWIVGIAESVAKTILVGKECDQTVQSIPNSVFSSLRFPTGIRAQFFDEIYSGINMYSRFLNLEQRTFPEEKPLAPDQPGIKLLVLYTASALFEPHLNYLASAGYTIATVATPDELKTVKEIPDHILLNTEDGKGPEELTPVFAILNEVPALKGKPVLVFTDDSEKWNPLIASDSLRKLFKEGDLRLIDIALESANHPAVK